jgi:hypothetical protein
MLIGTQSLSSIQAAGYGIIKSLEPLGDQFQQGNDALPNDNWPKIKESKDKLFLNMVANAFNATTLGQTSISQMTIGQ